MKAMSKWIFALGLLGCLALAALPAGAATYGFDNLAPGTSIENQTYFGVTYTSQGGDSAVYLGNQPNFGYISPDNTISNFGFLIGNTMTMTFTTPQNSFGFIGGDAGGDQDHFLVNAYDAANNLLGTIDTGVFGGNPLNPNNIMVDNYLISLSLNNMKYVTVTAFSVDGGAGILIDDVQQCNPIPLPPSVLLLGSGLLGLVGVGWRFKA
jgi:hypothetical protein